MKLFTELYTELDQTNKTNEKVEAMKEYFSNAKPENAAWALYFLSGRKPRQIVPSKKLREWALELSEIPEWLFEESRDTVGDTAETIALLLPNNDRTDETPLNVLVENRLLPLRKADESNQYEEVVSSWQSMNYSQRLIFNKLISGSFRVGVSQRLVMRALAEISGLEIDVIALRLMGNWEPTAEFFESVISSELDADETPIARPFPFHLAHQIDFRFETTRRYFRLASRMEMGRNSRSGYQTRRRSFYLVARRRFDHRTLSRNCDRRRIACKTARF